MLKIAVFPVIAACLLNGYSSMAQSTVTDHTYMDVNSITARVGLHGDGWLNPGTYAGELIYPKGTGKKLGVSAGLWITGIPVSTNTLSSSVNTYATAGVDYHPGPIAISIPDKAASAQRWSKIWGVTKGAIDSFLAITNHTAQNTPPSVLGWPATGNPYLKDALGAPLTMPAGISAPFIDVNGDGNYNPLSGDRPKLKGDKMLWFLTNDDGPTHDASPGLPIGLEIANTVYAFHSGGHSERIIYYEYAIRNRSTSVINSVRTGYFADLDIGYFNDDYIGFNSPRRLAYAYNGTTSDFVYGSGTDIPAAGMMLLGAPGDAPGQHPADYSTYYNDNGTHGFPVNPEEYNFVMQGLTRFGNAFHNMDSLQQQDWQCQQGLFPGDARVIVSSKPFTLLPGETKSVTYALVVADGAGGCPQMNMNPLFAAAEYAILQFNTLATGITGGSRHSHKWTLHPNPASGFITVTQNGTSLQSGSTVEVTDITGRTIAAGITTLADGYRIDVSALSPGVYLVRTDHGVTLRFVRE
jgi:hypothetical protein